jgi:hypothetical protein
MNVLPQQIRGEREREKSIDYPEYVEGGRHVEEDAPEARATQQKQRQQRRRDKDNKNKGPK